VIARQIVLAFGWLVIGTGGWVAIQPSGLVDLANVVLRPERLWIVIGLRLTIGALMWVSAATSRTPRTLKALGALMILSGLSIPLVGLEGVRAIVEWGGGLEPIALRLVGLITIGFGAFIVWSLWPQRSSTA
jgi:hypothetical protein